jgi:hypothetical protein
MWRTLEVANETAAGGSGCGEQSSPAPAERTPLIMPSSRHDQEMSAMVSALSRVVAGEAGSLEGGAGGPPTSHDQSYHGN